jgi:hypothetical protein
VFTRARKNRGWGYRVVGALANLGRRLLDQTVRNISLRRANITWRQQVGGSAIEASKIAGHHDLEMTGEYIFVTPERQNELTGASNRDSPTRKPSYSHPQNGIPRDYSP